MTRAALNSYLREADAQIFRYGTHDCALFAAGWLRLQTGRDLTLGAEYATLRDGLAHLRAAGFADHIEAAAAQLAEIPVAMAVPGDIAAVPAPRRALVLGIVTGERIAVLTRPRGVGFVPLTAAVRVFRAEGC